MAEVLKLEGDFSDFMPVKKGLYAKESLKVIAFHLRAGQRIALHTSPYKVITLVLKGEGEFFVGSEENRERLKSGEALIYEPMEPHGFVALEDMAVLAFVIG
ncbi:MAG: cupin domain-containing protein [Aquificaceae bacterium]